MHLAHESAPMIFISLLIRVSYLPRVLIIGALLVERVAAAVPFDYSEYFPSANASRVILTNKTSWPEQRCLIVYTPPKVSTRAIWHWAARIGYTVATVGHLGWRRNEIPVVDGRYDSQVFIGHGDVVSVRRAFASRRQRCLEWVHLRNPRVRQLSHIAQCHGPTTRVFRVDDELDRPRTAHIIP